MEKGGYCPQDHQKTVLADSLEKKYCSPATTDCEFTPDQWNPSNQDTLE